MPDASQPQGLPPREGPHRIVVVGGGAGGLELATRLGDTLGRRGQAQITLVDRARSHLWKPLLHEVAAGSLDVDDHELDYLAQAHWHHFTYRYGELVGLDRARKIALLGPTFDEDGRQVTPERAEPYDTLVIAIGSTTNDFGTPGVRDHAIPLETTGQARRFNRRLLNACIRAQTQAEPIAPGQLHVAIIGAGATGTELAAELHRATRQLVAYGMDRIDPERDLRLTLIEAAPRILPALPERLSEAATKLLEGLGVSVMAGTRVSAVTAEGVHLADGRVLSSELVVWSAGVKGPAVLGALDGLELARMHQLAVLPTLQTTRDADIFALPAAARPGGAPAGQPCAAPDPSPPEGRAGRALQVPRFRQPGLARPLFDRRQPDGRAGRQEPDGGGVFRTADVPLALQDAPARPAWRHQDRAGLAGPDAVAADGAAGQTALMLRLW
jgi:NADH dehydrogenase